MQSAGGGAHDRVTMAGSNAVTDVVRAVRRRWLYFLAVALPFAVVTVWLLQQVPNEYTSTSVISMTTRDEANVRPDVINLLIPKYQVYATSRSTIDRVAERTAMASREIRDGLAVEVLPDTGLLRISVTGGDPLVTAETVTAIADETLRLAQDDAVLSADVLIPATESTTPSGPPRRLSQLVAILFALAAGGLVAYLLERRSPEMRTLADVRESVELPVLGSVDRIRDAIQVPAVMLRDPVVAAEIGIARANLGQILRTQGLHSVAITSARAGEGKSTVAALLAASFAPSVRVLLIDADFERPVLAEDLGAASNTGLADVLDGTPLKDRVAPLPEEGFDLLGCAGMEIRHIDEHSLRQVLAQAGDTYDLVLMDVPPVLDGYLGRVLVATCDGTVIVARSGTNRRDLDDALASLQLLDVRVLGVLANSMSGSGTRQY